MILLGDEEWAKKSDRWVAEIAKVDSEFVAKVRPKIAGIGNPPPERRERKGGGTYPAKRKPKKPAAPPDPVAPPDAPTPVPPTPSVVVDEATSGELPPTEESSAQGVRQW